MKKKITNEELNIILDFLKLGNIRELMNYLKKNGRVKIVDENDNIFFCQLSKTGNIVICEVNGK